MQLCMICGSAGWAQLPLRFIIVHWCITNSAKYAQGSTSHLHSQQAALCPMHRVLLNWTATCNSMISLYFSLILVKDRSLHLLDAHRQPRHHSDAQPGIPDSSLTKKCPCSICHAADCLILLGACLQTVELKVTAILHLGQVAASAKAYPLAKKKQTMEFLREKMHLRAR